MWKQKIGIDISGRYDRPIADVIRIIKKAGFDAVSPIVCEEIPLSEVVAVALEEGLSLPYLHAPYYKAADMWSDDDARSGEALKELFEALALCKQYEIPTLVVHGWIGFFYEFKEESLNFARYDALVDRAEELGIKVAFENCEGEEFLFALLDRYEGRDSVGFCWDSGHEMCYNHSQDLLAKYGDRLLVTHLNDNLGISKFDGSTFWTDDLHLLPYDGIADWDDLIGRMRKARRLEFLSFELNISSKPDRHENDLYGKMSLEEYFAEAYKRACRIAFRYSR